MAKTGTSNSTQPGADAIVYLFPLVIPDLHQVLAIEKRTRRTAMFDDQRRIRLIPDDEFLNLHNELTTEASPS